MCQLNIITLAFTLSLATSLIDTPQCAPSWPEWEPQLGSLHTGCSLWTGIVTRGREDPPLSARSNSKAPLRDSNFGNSISKVHLKWPKSPSLLLNTPFFPTKTTQWKGSQLTDGWHLITWGWLKKKKVMSPGIFHNNRNHCLYSACLFFWVLHLTVVLPDASLHNSVGMQPYHKYKKKDKKE